MELKETVSKGVDITSQFIAEQERRFKLKKDLDDERSNLNSLYTELGKVTYHGKPYIYGRTQQAISDEITSCKSKINALEKELSTPAVI